MQKVKFFFLIPSEHDANQNVVTEISTASSSQGQIAATDVLANSPSTTIHSNGILVVLQSK